MRATQAGPLTNTASIVASDQPDPDPTDNAASATVTAALIADVAVTQAFTGATTPGLAAGYTIVVTNLGPSDVAGVTVTDLFPAALVATLVDLRGRPGIVVRRRRRAPAASRRRSRCRPATRRPSRCPASIAAGATGTLVNTATVAVPPGVTDGNAANDSATTSVPLTPSADLQISQGRSDLRRGGDGRRLYDRGHERGAVGRGRGHRRRPDAAGPDVRVECRRLHDRLPVRARHAGGRRRAHDHRRGTPFLPGI